MRACSLCKQIKTIDKMGSKGKHGWCKECLRKDMALRRKTQPEHYKAIFELSRDKTVARNVAHVRKLKEAPCSDCGIRYPFFVMQFDHRDAALKESCVATLAYKTASLESINVEIAKCDLVCANCHAIRTWDRKVVS